MATRPRNKKLQKEIDDKAAEEKRKFWKKVDEFLLAEGKGTEIAAYFNIHPDTLYERCAREHKVSWSAYQQSKKEKGDVILRGAQFHKAVIERNVQMQIFLGKNRLGQTDRQIIQTEEIKPQKALLKLPDNGRREIAEVKTDEPT